MLLVGTPHRVVYRLDAARERMLQTGVQKLVKYIRFLARITRTTRIYYLYNQWNPMCYNEKNIRAICVIRAYISKDGRAVSRP